MPGRSRQETAAASDAQLRAMADAATECIFIKDSDRRYTFVNRPMCRLFRCEPEGLIGHTPEELFDPASAATVRAVDDRTFGGEVVQEVRELDVVGERRVFSTTQVPLLDDDGEVRFICGFVQDVTAQHRIEREFQRQKEFADRLVDLVPALILTMDRQARVVRYNRYVEDLTGVPLEQATGRDWFETFVPPEERDRVREFYLSEAVIRPTTGSVNGVLVRDGERRAVEWHSRPLSDRDEGVDGVLAVGLDITQRLQVDEERRRLEREVLHAQRLESLAVLSGGVAHDFNNILVSVMGHASLAGRESTPGSPTAEALRQIEIAAARASDLCDKLLAFSGQSPMLRSVFDLNRLADETLGLLRVVISRDADLAWRPDPGPLPVDGDVTQIRQVLMNLVTNASEALGDAAGRIEVRTFSGEVDGSEGGQHLVTDKPAAGVYCVLEVADTGSGMDELTRRRIFDPFFSTKFPGRGLGLSAVLGIVRDHGGALAVDSTVGRGTCFRVLLPRAPGVREAGSPPGPDTGRRLAVRGGTVLVADDEPSNREVVRAMLHRAGFDVITVEDGAKAVERFREAPAAVRLVILDLTMPRLGGDETLHRIRQIRPDVPIVVMSGYGQPEVSRRLGDGSPSAFLRKPFTTAGLLEVVGAVLPDA